MVSKGSTSSGLAEASLRQRSLFANIYQVPTVCQALCSVLHAKGAEMSNRHACCQSSQSPGGRGHYYRVSFKGSMGVRSVEALHLSPAPTRPERPALRQGEFYPKMQCHLLLSTQRLHKWEGWGWLGGACWGSLGPSYVWGCF